MAGILLDTNVLSELVRAEPTPEVLAWFARQQDASFFVCAIIRAEILLGIALLPAGEHRDQLAAIAEQIFAEDFAGRCLPFDDACTMKYAICVAARAHQGRAISIEDAQIASVAIVHGLSLAARNDKDFKGIHGLTVLNPWA